MQDGVGIQIMELNPVDKKKTAGEFMRRKGEPAGEFMQRDSDHGLG
jgi:hypothetical protein